MFKRLRNYIKDFSAISHASSKDIDGFNSVHVGSFQPDFEIDLNWYEKPIILWKLSDINGWINSIVDIGKRSFFDKELKEADITNGSSLADLDFIEFHDIIKMVSDQVDLEISNITELLINFGYVKKCFFEKKLVDRNFPHVMKKVVENLPIEEYNILLNVPGHTRYYGERRIESCVNVIVKFVSFLLEKDVVIGQLNTFFESLLKNKDDNEIVEHKMQLIVIDQVVPPGGGGAIETSEQMVLQKKARKLLSPLVSLLPGVGEYGIFHVGLNIGDNLFCEWTTSSIILFTKVYTQIPVITLDVEPIRLSRKNKDDVIDDIASVIYDYNTKREYHLINCNCQHFCSDLLKSLSTKIIPVKGAFKKFLSGMKNKGASDTTLTFSSKFKKHFNFASDHFKEFEIINDTITFKTHMELDSFTIKVMKLYKGKDFSKAFPEYSLLKAFDDIMWIKYFNSDKKMSTLQKYKCLEENCKIMCPFKNGVEEESEVYKKILKRNEELNSIWYEHYMEDLTFKQWRKVKVEEPQNNELKKSQPTVEIMEL